MGRRRRRRINEAIGDRGHAVRPNLPGERRTRLPSGKSIRAGSCSGPANSRAKALSESRSAAGAITQAPAADDCTRL